MVGDFKNAGREWRPAGDPQEAPVRDIRIRKLGRAVPYGICDLAANAAWVSVDMDNDASAFAAKTIRRWRCEVGKASHPRTRRLIVACDGPIG